MIYISLTLLCAMAYWASILSYVMTSQWARYLFGLLTALALCGIMSVSRRGGHDDAYKVGYKFGREAGLDEGKTLGFRQGQSEADACPRAARGEGK